MERCLPDLTYRLVEEEEDIEEEDDNDEPKDGIENQSDSDYRP
jgi:hypothetical protein